MFFTKMFDSEGAKLSAPLVASGDLRHLQPGAVTEQVTTPGL